MSMEKGTLLYDQGRYDEAKVEFEQELSANPQNAHAHNGLGRVARVQQRHEDAERAFRTASELNSDEPAYHYNLGLALQDLKRFDEAASEFRAVLSLKSDYVLARSGLGAFLFDQGRSDEAKAEYEQVLSVNSRDAEAHNGLGRIAFAQQRYEGAERAFRTASESNPNEPAYHYNLGLALQNLKRLEEAEKEYRAALSLKSDYVLARSGLGALLFDRGWYDEAKAEYEQVLSIDPRDAEAHNGLGRVALRQQRYEDAEQFFRGAGEEPSAFLHLGSLLTLLERYEEAGTYLQKAVELDPKNGEAHGELGRFYYKQDKYVEAARKYREAVRLDPANVTGQQGLGLSLVAVERFEDAENMLRALLNPTASRRLRARDIWIIHATLADLFLRLGSKRADEMYYDEAAVSVDNALAGCPEDHKAALYFKRAIINCYRKLYEAAERDFQRCINLDETNWAAKRNLERLHSKLGAGRRSKVMEWVGIVGAGLAILLLLMVWGLFVFSTNDKVNSNTTMVMTLTPLFFGFIVVFFLLPQLSKLKLAGLEAEVEKMTPEPLEGPKGLRLEPGGALMPSSNIAPEPGRERTESKTVKREY